MWGRARLKATLATCAALAVVAPVAAASVPPSRGQPLIPRTNGHIPVGFNDASYYAQGVDVKVASTARSNAFANNVRLYRRAHAQVARYYINWASVQGGGQASWDWSEHDAVINNWLDNGIKVVIGVLGSPDWARNPADQCPQPGFAPWLCPPGDHMLIAWQQFVREVVKRYPRASAIEVWNEPNMQCFWPTLAGPNSSRYTLLLMAAYDGVNAEQPAMPVLGVSAAGATSDGTGSCGRVESIRTFLDGVLRIGGSAYMDGLAYHGYDHNNNPKTDPDDNIFENKLRNHVKGTLARYSEGGQPLNGRIHLWTTEMGANTSTSQQGCQLASGVWKSCTDQEQSDDVVADHELLDAYPDVDAMIIHTLMEPASGAETGWGLVRGSPRLDSPPGTALAEKCAFTNIGYRLQTLGFSGEALPGPATCP
jgi:hypothetical protein